MKNKIKYITPQQASKLSYLLSKSKKITPSLMEKTRAAVAYVNTKPQKDLEMYAFLSLFHPEMSEAKKRELCRKD